MSKEIPEPREPLYVVQPTQAAWFNAIGLPRGVVDATKAHQVIPAESVEAEYTCGVHAFVTRSQADLKRHVRSHMACWVRVGAVEVRPTQ